MQQLRQSPIDDRHRALGAAMTPFGGWDMPLHYGSVVQEHLAVRSGCGVFDLSHLGTFKVTGQGAQAALRAALTNDVTALAEGRAHYTLCLDEHGGIVDDCLVYHLPWGYFAVPNAANAARVLDAVDSAGGGDAEATDVKRDLACLAVQGPRSAEVLGEVGVAVDHLAYLDCEPFDPRGGGGEEPPPAGGVLARSGYTGERGYELFVPAGAAGELWDRLLEAGATPAGLGCRDTLRLEMGYPLHGNDISTETSPVEARLGWAVKPGGFRGEQAYLEAKQRGPARRLWGLRATGRGIPRSGCTVERDGQAVGEVTSGTYSPTLRIGIALAYLDTAVEAGEQVSIDVRGKAVPAEVVRPPFVDSDPKG